VVPVGPVLGAAVGAAAALTPEWDDPRFLNIITMVADLGMNVAAFVEQGRFRDGSLVAPWGGDEVRLGG
jgi:hypothetical protein